MERVQFQQEQMLPELKDLEEKGVFTKQEVKQILKKRTAFEMALVRRVAKKSDYVQYAGYEMQLETLRRKRVQRLKLNTQKKTISDYALVRRQLHIFERAVSKFKDDVGLWVQYIRLAQREGARTLAGKICARALRLHPSVPALYVLAAAHELNHLSPATARTLLQRGLRLNPESVDLWREYVRMELGYVESLRKRWELLGVPSAAEQPDGEEGEDSESARQMVLDGEIVRTVVANAAKAVPKIELFEALQDVLLSHPWRIRHGMIEHLHACLDGAPEGVRASARAAKLRATRRLGKELRGAELVERLGEAAGALAAEARMRRGGEASAIFADFTAEWCDRGAHDDKKNVDELVDAHLREFLVASLEKTLRACGRGSARSALETHVRLVSEAVGDGERAGRIRARYGLGGAE